MPVDYYIDSDSDFSETDMSLRGRNTRASFHRSSSRPRARPEVERTYLSPARQSSRVYRSASTGGRRPRDRESPPAVMIVNEQAQRTSNSNSRDNKPRRMRQQAVLDNDSDEEVLLRSSPGRRQHQRAASGVARAPSPYQRDYEVLLGQRMLEKNDFRQDMEIWKQKQEIARLEAELERHRQKGEVPARGDGREARLLREEEEWYEDEISDRLRRLERVERRSRSTEVERKLADQWRLKKFEEAEREAAGREELKAKLQEEKWKEIARQQEEEAEREKLKQEIIAEERQKAIEEEERKKKEIEMKAAAVEEWKIQQERIKQQEKELAEQKDKEFRERLRLEFGYTEEEIEEKLKKKNEKEKGKAEVLEPAETTWIKVHSKHLLPATLQAYDLPWDWDEDTNYIIIKRYITEEFQDELFAHSQRLRDNRVLAQTSSSTTELKVNDRGKDRLYLVRKKSPRRRSRIFA